LWRGVGVDGVLSHHSILVCSEPVPFEVSRNWSKVGVGKDVMMLQYAACASNVCCPIAPLATVNNKVYWWKIGNGESDARNSLNSTRGACLAVASRARVPLNETMCAGSSETAVSFVFRQTQGVYPRTIHWSVENNHCIDDVSRGQM
jgi:hypothetical protein